MVATVFIGALLLALLALLFYVGRMLFLAAGAPGGTFDAPSDSDYVDNLASASNSSDHSHHSDSSCHSHDSGSFDGGGHSHH